ncbi:MAG: phosphatase PAP2 family protein [Alistipes sp.]|nr:phosphatase PAP2 family protein [Alistipes sp.]
MNNTTWDWGLFDALNFDGGNVMDWIMSAISGIAMWIPLYAIIIYIVWRRWQWRGVVMLVVAAAIAMGLADIISGIFKHTGPLKELWSSFPVRQRPMFTEALDDVHVVSFAHGPYGTVSAHAATITALAVISSMVIARRWFSYTMLIIALLVCYSRIYLACHFPQDILLGAATGLLTGYIGARLFRYGMKRWQRV